MGQVELPLVEDLALARGGPAYDEPDDACVGRGGADVVEALGELGGRAVGEGWDAFGHGHILPGLGTAAGGAPVR